MIKLHNREMLQEIEKISLYHQRHIQPISHNSFIISDKEQFLVLIYYCSPGESCVNGLTISLEHSEEPTDAVAETS